MVKAHTPINWENEPSFNTPINETNLNKMDKTIGVLDDRIIEQDTSKLDKSIAYTMVKDISFNENNGVFTVTRLNGSTFTIDTRLEKIAINFKYDYSTQKLIVTLIDGTTQSIDMSALVTQYEFADSATLDFTTDSNGKVTATIKSGSITEDMLQPNYLAEIKVETAKSAQSMANAKISENNAKQSELNAKASEEQALEYSNNAQPLAQSVSGNNPTATNSTDGNVIYLKNSGYTLQDGEPTPDTPIHIDGLADKGYFDGALLQGEYSFNNGTFTARDNAITNANLIECKENDNITINYEEPLYYISVAFYDESKAFISGTNTISVSSATFTAPANAKFFRFSLNDYMTNLLIANAKHICVTINGQYAVRVKTLSKNWVKNTGTSKTQNGVTFTVNDDGTVSLNGTATANAVFEWNYKLDIKQIASERPIQSMSLLSGSVSNKDNVKFICYDVSETNTEVKIDEEILSWRFSLSKFRITVASGTVCNNARVGCMIRDAKITDGTFAPHQSSEALIPVSAPFYTGDYIDVYADGSGREYRVNYSSLLPKEGWIVEDKTNYKQASVYSTNTSAVFGESRQELISTHFGNASDNKLVFNVGSFWALFPSEYTNKEITNVFANNNIVFVGKRATPTSTPLTAEQVAEFLKLRTYRGVTYVTADGEVVMRYYVDNDSGETVRMLQSSLPQTYSREFEWLSPKLGHVQYFDFYFDKSYSKPPIVIPSVRGAGAQGIIPHVSYVNEEKCSITLYNAVDYSSNTMPVIVGGNVDILVY